MIDFHHIATRHDEIDRRLRDWARWVRVRPWREAQEAMFAMIDRQLATGMQAAREHAQVLATQGEQAARRWHRANAHRCTFFAVEGGRTVGLPSPFGRAG